MSGYFPALRVGVPEVRPSGPRITLSLCSQVAERQPDPLLDAPEPGSRTAPEYEFLKQ